MQKYIASMLSAVVLLAAANVYAAVDLTKLPLGDSKVTSTTPQVGYLYVCNMGKTGGGAQANGPWIQGSTWDSTQKLKVSGSVAWPSATGTFTISGTSRVFSGNDLPLTG